MREVIDSHQHFWRVGAFDYPWMTADIAVLYQDYLPPRLEPVMQANSIGRTVLVQASDSIAETRWMLSLADQFPFIAGVVGWVDLRSREVDRQLEELTTHPKFKGVRHLVENEPADDWLAQPEVHRGLRRLAARGVSYDLLAHTKHLPHAITAVENCPEVSFVLDHMAKPPIAGGDLKLWRERFQKLAKYPHVVCKLSGLVTEANRSSWEVADLWPVVETALECFGPRRLMFGSDWPVCLLAASYQRVLNAAQEVTASLSEAEKQRIFHDNAAEFYRL